MAQVEYEQDDPERIKAPQDYRGPDQPSVTVQSQPAPQQKLQAPSGVPQDWFDDFLRRNPGDQARAASAYAPTSSRQYDSQSGYYDSVTHQPIAGTPAANPAINAATRAQTPGASRTNFNYNNPGDQFSDPYTKALEDLVKQHLESIQKPQTNPALDKLLGFLDTRFNELTTNPGYSPAELAMLRTQAVDPIEQDRAAAQKRSLERIASRGMLQSSGLAEFDARGVDTEYDKIRGAAERDLGINALNRRNQDLNQALALGQMAGVQIPQHQQAEDQRRRNEAIQLSSLLYDLPRRSMQDALAVVNGSPMPGDLFSQAIQLMNAQNAQRQQDQMRNDAFWEQIGSTIGNIFR